MQPLFAKAPDAARRECHQFVVWRVISDFPPPFKNGGTDIVDPLIGHRADQLRKPKLPTERELDDEVGLDGFALDNLPLGVVYPDVESHPWAGSWECRIPVPDHAEIEVRRLPVPLHFDSLDEAICWSLTEDKQIDIALARLVVAESERAVHDDSAVREHHPTSSNQSLENRC